MFRCDGSRKVYGFTLVELLVCLAIIGLLAAVLLPTISRSRENARRTGCLSNCRQIAMAFLQYSEDSDDSLPSMSCEDTHPDNCNEAGYKPGARSWPQALFPYVRNLGIYTCPNDQVRAGMGFEAWRPMLLNSGWPGVTATSTRKQLAEAFPLSYASNSYLSNFSLDRPDAPPTVIVSRGGRRLSTLRNPSKLFLFTELGSTQREGWSHPDNLGDWSTSIPAAFLPPNIVAWPRGARHFEGRIFAFCDGHVKYFKDPVGGSISDPLRDEIYPSIGVYSYAAYP